MKFLYKRIPFVLLCLIVFTKISSGQSNTCAAATSILPDSTCVINTSSFTGTLSGATSDGGAIASSCTAVNAEDVWYKFVARTQFPTVTVSGLGSSWGTRLKIQLLSGTCGSFTEVACGNYTAASTSVTPSLTSPLTPGNTYYIRIYKNVAGSPTGSNWDFTICVTDPITKGSRLGEVFSRTILSDANVLNYPWEVTYGPDNNLWITEARGYKVYKMNPNTGVKTTVLDISTNSTFLPSDTLNAVNMSSWSSAWPQGGLAGLALHPKFLDASGLYNYVYISYIYKSLGGSSPTGLFYQNKLVRFKYNTSTGLLESPSVVCGNLPGSSDHNSQRIIVAPVTKGGTPYLFYAQGDMGAGQFDNRTRTNNAQNASSWEGKILRFNADTAGGLPWIPTTNPYGTTSPVYSIGIRNNQGFAYDSALNILYGASHGPYSDDEINIIQSFKNYGHPLVIGYADGNYDADTTVANSKVSAGAPYTDNSGVSSCPPVGNEKNRMNDINAVAATKGAYKGPLYAAYPIPATGTSGIANTWKTNPGNANWYSEAWSGLDLYQSKIIPGWNKSLVAAGLKWGRLIRLPLSTDGLKTLPSNLDSANTSDTVTYFQSTNRYRDLAFAPGGKDIFLVMDNSSATSGPGVGNPIVPACQGCVIKYSFIGYDSAANGLSKIPKTIPVANGSVNTCNTSTQVTIDGSNNFLWVPITGPDGNIVAEINAMGQNLGIVNTSFYKNSGAIRVKDGVHYLDRNITITPTITSFSIPVKVRLYISKAELDALVADAASGVGSIVQLKVIKNSDPCGAAIASTSTTLLTPTNTALADLQQGSNGYVMQVNVSSFSSFYFASSKGALPLELLSFTGTLQNNSFTALEWKTTNEINTSHFFVERSTDAQYFDQIAKVAAKGNSVNEGKYTYNDMDVTTLDVQYVYYRLKMYNTDGTYKYSNIIKVTIPALQSEMTVSPNPAVSEANAKIIAAEACNVDWQIIDNAGRVLLHNSTSLKKGNNTLSVNISQLSAGTYYLKVKGNCIDLQTKFQKL